jgi:chromate transporter
LIGKVNIESLKKNLLLWVFFLAAVVITIITQQEQVLLFVAAGLIYMFIKARPKWATNQAAGSIIFTGFSLTDAEFSTLGKIAVFFAKAGDLFLVVAWQLFLFCIVEL